MSDIISSCVAVVVAAVNRERSMLIAEKDGSSQVEGRSNENQKLPLIFLIHIQKTSGTSVRKFLTHCLGKDRVFWHKAAKPELRRNIVKETAASRLDLDSYRAIGGHVGFKKIPEAVLQRSPIFVATIRDPLSRAISLYQHLSTREVHPLYRKFNGATFNEALQVRGFINLVDCRQLEYLCGAKDMESMQAALGRYRYVIGKQENVKDFFATLTKVLGLKPRRNDFLVNASPSNYVEKIRQQPDFALAVERLNKLCAQERAFYESFENVLCNVSAQSQ